MSNIKELHCKPRLPVSVNLLFGVWAAMLLDSVVVHTHPRALPLPMITIKKINTWVSFSYKVMGLRLAVLRGRRSSAIRKELLHEKTSHGYVLRLEAFYMVCEHTVSKKAQDGLHFCLDLKGVY